MIVVNFLTLPITFSTALAAGFALNTTVFHELSIGIWINGVLTTACHSRSSLNMDHLEKIEMVLDQEFEIEDDVSS